MELFERTLHAAQDSGRNDILDSEFYFQYGQTAEQAALYDKAGTLLRKSLDMQNDPESIAQTANYLGYMYVDHNLNVEEGGNLIRRALEIKPDNGAYRDSMGWYYYRTSRFDKAVVELTKAMELMRQSAEAKETGKPEDPVVLEHLGDAYAKLKDTAKAMECWQRALELEPDDKAELDKKIESTKAQLTQGPAVDAAPAPDGKR